jgi:colanic acid/amylovoran biosynthesis glycosyltransferase
MRDRLAYLVSEYPTSSHTFVLREIVGLRALGFDVTVVAIRGSDRPTAQMTEIERAEAQRTTTVLPVRPRFAWAHLATVLRRPLGYVGGLWLAMRLSAWSLRQAALRLLAFMEAVVVGYELERVGLRHLHTHFASTPALLVQRVFGFSVSMTIHGQGEFDDAVGIHLREKVAAARLIIAISTYGKSQIMRFSDPQHWHKIEVCRLGVDVNWFQIRPQPHRSGVFTVVCVGRLVPVKAHRVLFKALEPLVKAGHRVRLRIVGDGPDRAELESAADTAGLRDVVVFEGTRNQDELLAIYRESDACVVASFIEGVPVVLMEALAMQIPCVATRVTGVPEIVEHGTGGLLVPPSSVEALTAALERLIIDPALCERLGVGGRARVVEAYDIHKNVSQLAEIFRRHMPLGLGPVKE